MDFLITPPGYVVDVCQLEMVGMGLVSSESKAYVVNGPGLRDVMSEWYLLCR